MKKSYEDMMRQINKAQMELKIKLEQVSRLRIDCAKLQLELLKLYKPQCLEILEVLRNVSAPVDFSNGDVIESRNDNQLCTLQNYSRICAEGNEVHRTNEDEEVHDVTSRDKSPDQHSVL